MSQKENLIDAYIIQLARRLHLPVSDQDQALREVRENLEDRARALRATGMSSDEADRQAIQAFGPVERISRQLRVFHPTSWGPQRWITSIILGAVVTWILWLVGTVPVFIYYRVLHPLYRCQGSIATCYPGSPQAHLVSFSPFTTLIQSSPLGSMAFYAFLTLGWLWLLPFLALYLILPWRWGNQARHWWMPGLTFGLGTWLAAPWFVLELFNTTNGAAVEGRIIAAALPLALLASCIGWLWRWRTALARTPFQTA